jgi:hypothetical protein
MNSLGDSGMRRFAAALPTFYTGSKLFRGDDSDLREGFLRGI